MQPQVAPSFRQYLSDNRQIVFALMLIIVIPMLLLINTLYVTRSMSMNMDYELRLKGEMASQITALVVGEVIDQPVELQAKVEQIAAESLYDSILSLEVLVPQDRVFEVAASTNPDSIGATRSGAGYNLVWREDGAYSTLKQTRVEGEDHRYWEVMSPIHGTNGELVGVIEMDVSTRHLDVHTERVRNNAFILMVVSIVVVLLLIATNAKLFHYARLFTKLKEVDKMKDDFISVASHELKTPVTAAKGFLSLVAMENAEIPERVQYDLKKAEESLDRLSELVNDLLDVSRIEQDRLKLQMYEVDVREMLKRVVDEMRPAAETKGLKFTYAQHEGELPKVVLDNAKYRQVLTNLMSNAIKYTMQGEVEISVVYEELGEIRISVRDTGIGMSSQEVNRLFTKFYRIRNRKAKDVVGTGLGLWITKQLMEIMNGKIQVESVEDVGSKFTLVFPVSKS